MERQCLIQNDGTLVLVSGNLEDELTDVVNAAHNEYQWLQKKERAQVFANHR